MNSAPDPEAPQEPDFCCTAPKNKVPTVSVAVGATWPPSRTSELLSDSDALPTARMPAVTVVGPL